jgi:hypothetical protein
VTSLIKSKAGRDTVRTNNELNYRASLARFNELSAKIKARTQSLREQAEIDNMLAVTVKTNTGEIAKFTDGGKIIRNIPSFEPALGVNYKTIIQPAPFKSVFKVGLTKSEVNERLKSPPQ